MEQVIRKCIAEINGGDLKNYIISSKACVVNTCCELEAKFGSLILSFANYEVDEAEITLKRCSGNGLVLIKSGGNMVDRQISSKVSEKINIRLDSLKKIDVKRPYRSRGALSICGISLFNNNYCMRTKWTDILKRCTEYSCLKVVDDKLMASEGAIIIADSIGDVETEPAGMFTKENNRLIFLGSCEIKYVDINGTGKALPDDKFLKCHLKEEPQILIPEPKPAETKRVDEICIIKPTQPSDVNIDDSRILFDTNKTGFNAAFGNAAVRTESSHTVVGHKGEYKIPASFMENDAGYIVVVEANVLRGNGKFIIDLSPTIVQENVVVLASPHKKTYSKTFITAYYGSDFYVSIKRPIAATGDVCISRIMVLSNFPSQKVIMAKLGAPLSASAVSFSYNIFSLFDYTEDDKLNDRVKQISKQFAILPKNNYTTERQRVNGCIDLVSCGSKFWFNKIINHFDGLGGICNYMLLNGGSTDGTINLSICSVDAAAKTSTCRKIFLEEFDNDAVIPDSLGTLSLNDMILTPSMINMYKLKDLFPQVKVEVASKPWPAIPEITRQNRNKYFVYFEKYPDITKLIYENWNCERYGRLCVIGTRQKVPDFATYVSEYDSYDNLYRILVNSFGVIDITSNKHYISGIIDLSLALGLNVVTNNHAYILKSNYIIRNSLSYGKYYIEPEDFVRVMDRCVGESIERQQSDMRAYNCSVRDSIIRLVSA